MSKIPPYLPLTMLNIPNTLTVVRGLLTIPLIHFILAGRTAAAITVFINAMMTEIDGTVARFLNQKTDVGIFLDPFIDGIFMLGGLLSLIITGILPTFYVFLLALASSPRLLFLKPEKKKKEPLRVALISKYSGFLVFMLIPLGILEFLYIVPFLVFTVIYNAIAVLLRSIAITRRS